MSNQITNVVVSQQVAPVPNTLQRTGAFISQGGTTLAVNQSSLLTQLSDLTPLLAAPVTLASVSWSGGVATATVANTTIVAGSYNSTTGLVTLTLTATVHLLPGMLVYVSGATGTGSYASINGEFTCGTGTTGTTLTYSVATGLTMTITGGAVYATHGVTTSATFSTTIAGATPSVYNGTYVATATSQTQFTYSLASDGGTTPATGTITYTPEGVTELIAMATTFFAQGNGASVYVLELGQGTAAAGVTVLTAYLADPSLAFYGYLAPSKWGAETTAVTLASNYASDTSKVYFWITTTIDSYPLWETLKSVVMMIQSPDAPLTEFSLASMMYVTLNYNPSATNKVTPTAFSYVFGVTPYVLTGPQQTAAKAARVNWIGTGAEGGITNKMILWGTTADGRDFTYWYSVDWVQINAQQAITNAVINGSNNPTNPLYYDQNGINRLQAVAQAKMNSGVSFGLVSGAPIVTAVPFATYVADNPNDYPQGIYNGLAVTYTPNRGFTSITFYVTVSDFAAA